MFAGGFWTIFGGICGMFSGIIVDIDKTYHLSSSKTLSAKSPKSSGGCLPFTAAVAVMPQDINSPSWFGQALCCWHLVEAWDDLDSCLGASLLFCLHLFSCKNTIVLVYTSHAATISISFYIYTIS